MLCTIPRRDLNQTIRQGKERISSAFHMMCPRYSESLPIAPMVIRLWETFTFTFFIMQNKSCSEISQDFKAT